MLRSRWDYELLMPTTFKTVSVLGIYDGYLPVSHPVLKNMPPSLGLVWSAFHRGKMKPDELEKAIIRVKDEGKIPLFVNATASTTVLGSFDPINDIADVCEKYGIWLHVDVSTV